MPQYFILSFSESNNQRSSKQFYDKACHFDIRGAIICLTSHQQRRVFFWERKWDGGGKKAKGKEGEKEGGKKKDI